MICDKTEEDPRFFEGDLMFNFEKNSPPSFHITLPAESPSDGNSVGIGEGTFDEISNETEEVPVLSRRVQTNYNIVIVSDNSMEVTVLYHFMRALLVALNFHLNEKRLQNITYAGQDIQPYKELDNQLYMRAMSLGIQYEVGVPSFHSKLFKTAVEVSGAIKE